jgi:hypothetical protein
MIEQYIDYIFVGAIISALIGYFIVLRKLAKTRNNNAPDNTPSTSPFFPIAKEQTPVPVTIVRDEEPQRTKRETLDVLLTEAVKQNIQRLDVAPQITLTNKGEYRILGKTWSGEVNVTIKPKKTGEEATEKTKEKTAEETEEEKEESLF